MGYYGKYFPDKEKDILRECGLLKGRDKTEVYYLLGILKACYSQPILDKYFSNGRKIDSSTIILNKELIRRDCGYTMPKLVRCLDILIKIGYKLHYNDTFVTVECAKLLKLIGIAVKEDKYKNKLNTSLKEKTSTSLSHLEDGGEQAHELHVEKLYVGIPSSPDQLNEYQLKFYCNINTGKWDFKGISNREEKIELYETILNDLTKLFPKYTFEKMVEKMNRFCHYIVNKSDSGWDLKGYLYVVNCFKKEIKPEEIQNDSIN